VTFHFEGYIGGDDYGTDGDIYDDDDDDDDDDGDKENSFASHVSLTVWSPHLPVIR
jgi:hypothetical protein